MTVLVCLDWLICSGNVVTFLFLLIFLFGLVFKIMRV